MQVRSGDSGVKSARVLDRYLLTADSTAGTAPPPGCGHPWGGARQSRYADTLVY